MLQSMRKNAAGKAPPPEHPPPDPATLREAALAYVARFAATEAGLARVLERRIERWARGAQPEGDARAAVKLARASIPKIVNDLVAAGAVSDARFVEARTRALVRSGRSRRAIGAHLAARGVAPALATQAMAADPGQEFAAALIHARKRRLGPWRKCEASPDAIRKEMGSFARAGFAHDIAARVLAYGHDEAEAAIAAFRSEW